ncbi:MAG: nicotinate (nicotinamide) nucleotide adenylyltransferase [Oscillospiraceae bacterium]|nr:nicotinate (nicotinamide) nucleotide adenylyltransferase [Oscillospiraceae bacterium]
MKTGIFGGSFNPVHNGHIHLAESIRDNLSLDRVIFVPSKISPHKSSSEYVPEIHRLKMLELAIQEKKSFEVSDYEIRCERISYSIYTVEHFHKKYPSDELYLLIGSDMLLSFDTWYRFRDIMSLAALAVVSRNSGDFNLLSEKAVQLSQYGKIIISSVPPFPASSTEIRKKISKNQNYACYLNKNVVQYITSNNLYK